MFREKKFFLTWDNHFNEKCQLVLIHGNDYQRIFEKCEQFRRETLIYRNMEISIKS